MPDFSLAAMLTPIREGAPCGDDLEYDPLFLALEEAARGKAEQQFGATVISGQDPDWRNMKDLALDLLQRTRDLRVAIQLLRADSRLEGLVGFANGLRLVRGLVEQHWDHVHPQLDASDHNDPTMRMNALVPLGDTATVVADLRQALIGRTRGFTVRQVELGLGRAEAGASEHVPTQSGVAKAMAALRDQEPEALTQMLALADDVAAIQSAVDARAGIDNALDLRVLRGLSQALRDAARMVTPTVAPVASSQTDTPPDRAPVARSTVNKATPDSRDDVVRMLDRACEWIALNEPTNPAPLLIRRAQRLMTKSFMEIVRDIAPEAIRDVERLAGVETQ